MIDVDAGLYIESKDGTKETLVLIETALDAGQDYKPATILCDLARRSSIPAFVVLYTPSTERNPADPRCQDIAKFRVRRIWPRETGWYTLTPEEWSRKLLRIRNEQAESNRIDRLNQELFAKSVGSIRWLTEDFHAGQ